jgi:hypothetical protein
MRTINYLLASLLLLTACNNNERRYNDGHNNTATTGSTGSTTGRVETDDESKFEKEMEDYRYRLNKRIDELKADIEKTQRERKMERDIKKQRRYDARIEERERRRKSFQETLDRLETQTEEGWQNFKQDMNNLFDRDKGQDTTWTAK